MLQVRSRRMREMRSGLAKRGGMTMLGITALDIIRAVLITIAVMVSYNMGLKQRKGGDD